MSNYRVKMRQGRHLERWQKVKLKMKSEVKQSLKNLSYQTYEDLNPYYELCNFISTQQKQILVVNIVSFAIQYRRSQLTSGLGSRSFINTLVFLYGFNHYR